MQVQTKREQKKEQLKVGFVGPSKPKWKNSEQYERMKKKLEEILVGYGSSFIDNGVIMLNMENVTVVSGHCPVGEERPFDVTFGDFIPKYLVPTAVEWAKEKGHKIIKVYDQGGVDTEAEIIAHQLGCKTEIYPAEVHQWSDKTIVGKNLVDVRNEVFVEQEVDLKGYRSRNIQIAKAVDVLYCIVPFIENAFCYHHPIPKEVILRKGEENRGYEHPQNGGCWTFRYAKEKLGKETHLVVIE